MGKLNNSRASESDVLISDDFKISELTEKLGNGEISLEEFRDGTREATGGSTRKLLLSLFLYWISPFLDWVRVRILKKPLFPGGPS